MTPPRATPTTRLALAGAALAVALSGCGPQSGPDPSTPASAPSGSATISAPASPAKDRTRAPGRGTTSSSPGERPGDGGSGTALAALDELPVKGRAPKTGYSRDEFGPRWADTDHNGCDTRNDILRRDLTEITVKPGTHGCTVSTGALVSVYTGEPIDFTAGRDTSSQVQIDHVVALSDAWQKGAQQLDAGRRTELANDPLNLLAVDGPSNNAKSDGDAATWLPPATGERCEYVATQIAVKRRYELWVTDAEKNAMTRVLDACPEQGVPDARAVPAPGGAPEAPAPERTAHRTPAGPAAGSGPGDGTRFASCAEARAAGAAPLHAGAPGYRPALDGDGDGVACESAG